MKMFKTTLLAATALFSTALVQAQTADEIISKHISAIGGKEKISQIKSLYMEGAVDIMGNEAPMTSYILNGKGYKSEMEFNGQKIVNAMNEKGGEENIATGWHAIEFMLWGQDLSETGPGNRSFEDFVDGKALNADRRRQYLNVVTELLVDDLSGLVKAWAPGAKNNYRARFEKGGNESLRKMFVSMGSLSRGELAGERLEVALASQDQEDEHSCFSDNTHRDAVTNAKGIENVWLGRYVRADGGTLQGPSLRDLVNAKDAALAEKTSKQIRTSVEAAEAIPAPFDRAIAAFTEVGRTRGLKEPAPPRPASARVGSSDLTTGPSSGAFRQHRELR